MTSKKKWEILRSLLNNHVKSYKEREILIEDDYYRGIVAGLELALEDMYYVEEKFDKDNI